MGFSARKGIFFTRRRKTIQRKNRKWKAEEKAKLEQKLKHEQQERQEMADEKHCRDALYYLLKNASGHNKIIQEEINYHVHVVRRHALLSPRGSYLNWNEPTLCVFHTAPHRARIELLVSAPPTASGRTYVICVSPLSRLHAMRRAPDISALPHILAAPQRFHLPAHGPRTLLDSFCLGYQGPLRRTLTALSGPQITDHPPTARASANNLTSDDVHRSQRALATKLDQPRRSRPSRRHTPSRRLQHRPTTCCSAHSSLPHAQPTWATVRTARLLQRRRSREGIPDDHGGDR